MTRSFCVGVLWVAMLVVSPAFADERVTTLGTWMIGSQVYLAQDLPFAEATIVVVHPWTFGVDTIYVVTLDGAPLAALKMGQHVIWRTAPRDLILGMKSRDGLHPPQALRAQPGGNYYFRTSPRGLDRTTEAEGRSLVGLSTHVEGSWTNVD